MRQRIDLVAPEIDHVNETLATPVADDRRSTTPNDEPEGYLDNAAELGPLASRIVLDIRPRRPRSATTASSAAPAELIAQPH